MPMIVPASQTASGLPWHLRAEDERTSLAIAQQHGVNELVAAMLCGRGVTVDQVPHFLAPSLRDYLPDPFHLKDMDKAVARLKQAIDRKERVVIFGDYDVDGATSSAQLVEYFAALGIAIEVYIPDRLKEGYGPTMEAFAQLIDQGAQLIVTVDCGTLSHAPIAYAKERGVDVIVLDHHLGGAALPPAVAVVNPNRADETSEHRNLAAAGVTFLTLVALNKTLRDAEYFKERAEPNLLSLLDLVALGTVCDVMTLTGLNRAYVTQGLKVLARRARLGLNALADVARMDGTASTYHLGFLLGPRINAGGRVGESNLGVRLLTSQDELEARDLAARLHQLNLERQAIEASVSEQAFAQAERQTNQSVILVAGEGWHAGVIGIVAGRLKEKFARPAAVIALENGVGKGSARSVPGADFGAAIHAAQQMGIVTAGGGHAMAAGFSLDAARIGELQAFLEQRLSAAVAAYSEGRSWKFDGWVTPSAANLQLLEEIQCAGPFGLGNPGPRFALKAATILHRTVLKEKHVKLVLGDELGGPRLQAIAFNVAGTKLGEWLVSERILHLAGELKCNVWQGESTAQFIVEDAAKPLAA